MSSTMRGPQNFCAPSWRSSADFSRPAGDKPQRGDYLLTEKGAWRIEDVKHDRDGWNLLCEPVGGVSPWETEGNPEVRVFDWNWRVAS